MSEHQMSKQISDEQLSRILDSVDKLAKEEAKRQKFLRNRIARWLHLLAGKIEIDYELSAFQEVLKEESE